MANEFSLPKLVRRAHQKKKSLGLFLNRVKRNPPKDLQKQVKAADKATWAEVECLSCANCCRTMTPTFKKSEVKVIAAHLKMSYKEYFDKYLMIDDDNGDIVNRIQPCQHLNLKDNKCSIYAIRPSDCSGFPHHVRKDFLWQIENKTYLGNIPRCPATLIFVEKLQQAMEGAK
jgi:hypothetical protein